MTATAPTVTAARKRGVIRIDLNLVENSRVVRLTDTEWRAYFSLLPWVARYCENADGEFPREWLESFSFGFTPTGRPRRITEKLLARLAASGLVEEYEYDDGSWTVVIVGWRDFRPVDSTSAERKRRHRRRKYGARYHGTEGDVMEVRLESAEEVAAIEALDRKVMDEVERRGVAAVLGEVDAGTPSKADLKESCSGSLPLAHPREAVRPTEIGVPDAPLPAADANGDTRS